MNVFTGMRLAGVAAALLMSGWLPPGSAEAQQVEVDHVLWGVPDLAAGAEEIAELTGAEPAFGGVHPGRGSANYLLSMGGSYLEVIGPDPDETPPIGRGAGLAALDGPEVQTFAIRTTNIDGLIARARAAGLMTGDAEPGARATPSGAVLHWRSANFESAEFGGFIPFAIQWSADSPHPATTSPKGIQFVSLAVTHPRAEELAKIYAALGIPVEVSPGEPRITLTIDTPRGLHVLTSDGVAE